MTGLLLAASACVSTKALFINASAQSAPHCPDGVEVFTDSGKVGRPYSEIALLSSEGEGDMTSVKWDDQLAGEEGSQGWRERMILGQMEVPSTGAKDARAFLGTSANRKGFSIAIHIPSNSARVTAACKISS